MSLFISEYIEGSGNNKAIELFNNSDSLIDLGANGYSLEFYFNGSDTAGTSIELTGTVDSNGVFVVADNDADAAILAQTDLTSNSSFFNGDDAIALLENGVVIDSIGQIGFDPGSEWGSGDVSTQNNTLRRNSDITVGDSNPDDTFDPSLEWSGFPQDTFDDLGSFNGAGGGGGNSSSITINEVDADTPGSDSAEFIELFDGGTGNSSLDGLVAVLYNGNGDSSYAAFDLDGFSTDSNGFFVLGNEAVANVGLTFSNNTLQNGADAVALYQGDAADFPNGTVVTAEGLVDAIVYDTSDGDDSELLTALGQSTQFDEAANGNQDNESNSRVPDGTGSFITQAPTPGVSNEQTPPPVDNFVPIFNIQGAALVSPLNSSQVSTTGIVTAVESNGFYLQDPTGDNNTATADGIFVFTSSAPGVSVGDALEVAGTVSEFTPGGASSGNLSTTQISNANITTVSTGNTLPAAVIIGNGGRVPPTTSIDDNPSSYNPDADGIDFFESLEGMLVTAQDTVAVAGTNRFGEIFTVVDGGAGATGISDRNTLNISPDDFNPEKVQIDQDSDILPDFDFPEVNVGDSLGNVTGVISYDFGNFQINPTQPFSATPANLTAEVTSLQPGAEQLTVASYNVLNLDPNDDDGDTDVADGRYEAIADDIVTNLNTPDIIGLQEIQDNNGSVDDGVTAADANLQQLVDAIAANGGTQYEFIDNTFIVDGASGGQPGGNIQTAFLYNPDRVDLVEGSVRPIGDQAPGSPFNGARLPLVADFAFNGQEVTVIDNHFSSKGGSSPIFGVDQPFEELQENPDVNGSLDERQAQAEAVDSFVEDILGDNPDANVAVLGDLNEFEFISPVDEILGSDLTNLVDTLPEDERYSFIFQGNSQQLDHILVSDSLLEGAEFDIVHVNTEFAETPQRASDHDPIIASLTIENSEPEPPEVNEINGTRNDDSLRGTSANDSISGNNGNDTLEGVTGNDTLEGGRGGDSLRGGAGDDILAADRIDRFQDFDGTDSFLGGDNGNDTIFGGGKNDTIGGGNGNDVLFGKSGDDLIRAGGGDDLLNGGIGNDTLRGQRGNDTADYSDLTFNGVFGNVPGLDANLSSNSAVHSSNNNALTWTDTLNTIENVTGTQRNDRFIGNSQDNIFDGQGEVNRSDRQTQFTSLSGENYTVIADVVEYQGSQADFTFTGSADNFTAAGSEGNDTLIEIEFVRFNADNSVIATSDLSFT
ncbi:MAG: lamin tail domain-containing protein [Cyanobacteria bacterium J06648_1]